MIELFLVVFLIWTFSLSYVTSLLTRKGKLLSASFFFYASVHSLLFKHQKFNLLLFSVKLCENVGRIAFTLLSALFFYYNRDVGILCGLMAALLIFGDFLPRLICTLNSMRFVGVVASFFLTLTTPLTLIFAKLLAWSLKKEKSEEESLNEMKEIIVEILQGANIQTKLSVVDRKLIESVIVFKDLIVREAMIPRIDLFALSASTTIREAAKQLAVEGYSRIPVYRGTIDNIVGMLMYKDILEIYMECESGKKEWKFLNTPIETVAKTVFYTPETGKVSHLLQEFRTKQMHMAIVVDEYGGTAGVVTIEDLLEEIVGEIADEYDEEEEILYTPQAGGGSWIVDGRMNIKDAEDTFDIHIPQEGDYDTIGGYLFHKLGTVPQKGIVVHHDDFDLEILISTERSVDKVRLTPHRRTEDNQG